MKELTERQKEIVSFIKSYLNDNLQMPTQEEIAKHFSFTTAAAHYHIVALEKKKAISLEKGESRGIRLCQSDREKRENIEIDFFQSEPSIDDLDKINAKSYYIPRSMKLEKPFAFTVTSLSMKDAGILINDIAIMEKTSKANNGDIVLAYIPNSQNKIELRRIIKTPHFFEFQSENENMGNIKSMNAIIYGVLKAIRRNYY